MCIFMSAVDIVSVKMFGKVCIKYRVDRKFTQQSDYRLLVIDLSMNVIGINFTLCLILVWEHLFFAYQ